MILITIIIGNLATLKAVSTPVICTFAKLFIVHKLRVELNCTQRALFYETIMIELLWWTKRVYGNCDLQFNLSSVVAMICAAVLQITFLNTAFYFFFMSVDIV